MMKNIHFFRLILFFALCAVLFSSCKRKSGETSEAITPEIVEYPRRLIQEQLSTSVSDQTPLYPVSEEFLQQFLQKAEEYEGTPIQAHTQLPAEWGVVCVEQLPEGRELWLIQSQDREWMYLVITSGLGTQRIIDLLPVAVNLAIQDRDVLETEIWNTLREPDGTFLVEKNYEWIKSIAEVSKAALDSNRSKYQKMSHVVDRYYINEMSRFEYIPKQDSIEYSAVIFYYNQENKPEEWDEYIPILQSYCEEKNIFYDEIYSGYNNIRLRDFRMNDIAELDITPYMGVSDAGMVMFKTGQEPKNVSFGSTERLKVEIKRYFNLLNQ